MQARMGVEDGVNCLLANHFNMKHLSTLLLILIASQPGFAQEKEMKLSSFRKIVVSPKIKLVLVKGDAESIRVTASNIHPAQLNVRVIGNKLHLYLDDARYIEKSLKVWENNYRWNRGIYHDASVTAYVTYKELRSVEMRGEERLVCEEEITGDKFKIRAYGRTEIRLASVKVGEFKATLYGENSLRIASGETGHQKFTLYGENMIDMRAVESKTAATTIYGEGSISMNVIDEVRLNAFGEPFISIDGPAHVSRGIVIGPVMIRSRF